MPSVGLQWQVYAQIRIRQSRAYARHPHPSLLPSREKGSVDCDSCLISGGCLDSVNPASLGAPDLYPVIPAKAGIQNVADAPDFARGRVMSIRLRNGMRTETKRESRAINPFSLDGLTGVGFDFRRFGEGRSV